MRESSAASAVEFAGVRGGQARRHEMTENRIKVWERSNVIS
jgi:hypothetical protein